MVERKIGCRAAIAIVAALLLFPAVLVACMPAGSQINGLFPSPIVFCGVDELPGGG